MPANKKIIFLIPTLLMGGGERVVSELSLNLPDSIEKIIVLFQKQATYPYKGKLVSLDIPLNNNFLFKIFYFFVAVSRFRKIVKKEKPDFVVSFVRPANIINVLSGAKAVLRVDSFLSSLPGFWYKILVKIFYSRAFRIVCVSNASAGDLALNFGVKKEKIKVIYNPLNLDEINKKSLEPLEKQHLKIFENPVIINVGRLDKWKNQELLVKILPKIKEKIPRAQLVILGKGYMENDLKKEAKNLGVEGSVHFLGWQDNPYKFLARSKVFASSSLREGLPFGILEALSCGLPVVSADCDSGPKEILQPLSGKFGIVTPPIKSDEKGEKIKEAIISILSDQKIALDFSKAGQARAKDFDIKNIIKQWKFIYE